MKLADVIHWIFIVFVAGFVGAPLLAMSVRWWASVMQLSVGRIL